MGAHPEGHHFSHTQHGFGDQGSGSGAVPGLELLQGLLPATINALLAQNSPSSLSWKSLAPANP